MYPHIRNSAFLPWYRVMPGTRGVKRSTRKIVNDLSWCRLHRISLRNSSCSSYYIEMIHFGCLPAASINERQQPLRYWLPQSLAQVCVLVDLSPPLIDYQPLDSSHSSARSFVDSTWAILSVRNSPLLEHLDVAVSDDPLDLGEVKLCLLVFDTLGHPCITSIYSSLSSSLRKWHFQITESRSSFIWL